MRAFGSVVDLSVFDNSSGRADAHEPVLLRPFLADRPLSLSIEAFRVEFEESENGRELFS